MKERLNDPVILAMFEVLSASLGGISLDKSYGPCWDALSKELVKQAIEFIPGNSIASLGLSNDQYIEYQNNCGKSVRSFYSMLSSQNRVLEILESNSIPTVVLKGASAATNYPRPELRSMGDIDIIVLPEDFERAKNALSEAGFAAKKEQLDRHHAFTDENGCEIELHKFFSASRIKSTNEYLDNLIYDGIRRRQYARIEKYTFPILPPAAEAGVLVSHINQHIIYGIGLRQIIDWALFVQNKVDDKAWDNGIHELLDTLQMTTLAKVSVAMCKKFLHICTRISWCDDVDENLCDRLMEYLLHRGNFGNAEQYGTKGTTNVLVQFSSIKKTLLYFQKGGEAHWKACQRHPILKPLAWAYQLGHVTRMVIRNKVGISTMIKSGKTAQSTYDLMQKLGVTNF